MSMKPSASQASELCERMGAVGRIPAIYTQVAIGQLKAVYERTHPGAGRRRSSGLEPEGET